MTTANCDVEHYQIWQDTSCDEPTYVMVIATWKTSATVEPIKGPGAWFAGPDRFGDGDTEFDIDHREFGGRYQLVVHGNGESVVS